jgi:DNA-binding protein HU-beta
VNKSELVDRVAEAAEVDKRRAEAAVEAMVDAVISDIKAGNKVSIFGFGTFAPTSRAARTGRNPRTGEAVQIAASNSVKFSPASVFKSALNSGGGRGAGAKKASSAKTAGKKTAAKKSTAKKATKSSKKR